MANFININDASVSLSVSTTSANVATGNALGSSVLIDNTDSGSLPCFIKAGVSGVTATTSDLQIASGEKAVYAITPGMTHIAAITASGTTTLRLVRGNGGE